MLKNPLKIICNDCGCEFLSYQSNKFRRPKKCTACKKICKYCKKSNEINNNRYCSRECRRLGLLSTRPCHNKGKTKENYEPLKRVSEKMRGNKVNLGRCGIKNGMFGKKNESLSKYNRSWLGMSYEEKFGKEKGEKMRKACGAVFKRFWANEETRKGMIKKRIEQHQNGKYNFLNGRHKSGRFYSLKNGKVLFYRSSYELLAFQLLESINEVLKYEVNPISIEYKWNNKIHRYLIDLLVYYKNGDKQLIEVKAKWQIDYDEKTRFKLEAGREFAEQNGMKFNVWAESQLGLQK